MDGNADFLSQHLELLDGGGTHQVTGGQQGLSSLLCKACGQLGGGGGLSRSLETQQQDDRQGVGPLELELLLFIAQEGYNLVVDNLDELLSGINRPQDLFALGLLDGAVDKAAHHPQVHVGFQQGKLDLLYGLFYILLRNGGLSAELADHISKGIGNFL